MGEFEPIFAALRKKPTPTKVFIRDDDAPWAIDRLRALTERCCALDVPIDIAVIPTAVEVENKAKIVELCRTGSRVVRLHQHGYAHVNHQLTGRKCEFGDHRDATTQRRDIVAGRELLCRSFSDYLDPIFTPPWNRCSQATLDALDNSGIQVLSRIVDSDTLQYGDVLELPVTIDWQKQRKGQRLRWPEFCHYAADQFTRYNVVGIMLHHAVMDSTEVDRFSRFIQSLIHSNKVEFSSMMHLAPLRTEPGC